MKNGVVLLKHTLNSIDAKNTVHWKTPDLTLTGIVNFQVLMKSYNLYVTSILSQ